MQTHTGSSVNPYVDTAMSVGKLGSSLYKNYQLKKTQDLLSVLQTMQIANLAISGIGLGISIAGFLAMRNQIDKMLNKISALDERIVQGFAEQHSREIRTRLSRLRALFDQMDSASTMSVAADEWRRLARRLGEEASFYRGEVDHLLQREVVTLEALDTVLKTYTVCQAQQVQALLLAEETKAALSTAAKQTRDMDEIFDDVSPALIARKTIQIHDPSDKLSVQPRRLAEKSAIDFVHVLREAQDMTASRPLIISNMIERNINSREYINILRRETEHPVLIFPID